MITVHDYEINLWCFAIGWPGPRVPSIISWEKKQLCAPSVLGTSKLNPIPHGHTRWVPSLRRYHIGGAPDFHAWTWRALDAMGGA